MYIVEVVLITCIMDNFYIFESIASQLRSFYYYSCRIGELLIS